MRVYFDRNIFAEIVRRQERGVDLVPVLRGAAPERKFDLVLSTTLLEETLPLLKDSPGVLRNHLRLIFTLVESQRMIKPPDVLLREAVQSYAYNRRLPDMFTRTPKVFQSFLTTGKVTPELNERIAHEINRREKFAESMTAPLEEANARLKEIARFNMTMYQEFWDRIWDETALHFGELVALQYGVRGRCIERGLAGLIDSRTVRLFVAYFMFFFRAKLLGQRGIVGTAGKVRASELGDSFHSVQASAADIFVSEDSRLVQWLNEIPWEGFEIIRLDAFINRIS